MLIVRMRDKCVETHLHEGELQVNAVFEFILTLDESASLSFTSGIPC